MNLEFTFPAVSATPQELKKKKKLFDTKRWISTDQKRKNM